MRQPGKTILLTTTLHLASTARLAMALTDSGCQVAVLGPPGHWIRHTTRVWRCLHYSGVRPLRSLEKAIEETQADFVIPCDDRAVLHAQILSIKSTNEAVASVLRRSLCASEHFAVTQSRQGLMALAARESVLVPDNCAVTDIQDLRNWLPDHPLPWVIKADGSWAGMGVRVVGTLAQAEAVYNEMSHPVSARTALSEALIDWDFFWLKPWLTQQAKTISVQRYIKGRATNCAMACWRGEVIGCISVEVLMAESDTGPATVVQVIDNPSMYDNAARIVNVLNFTGMIGFDFILDATENAYMIEMNPRNVPLCHVALGGERDLVECLLARLEQRPTRQRHPVTNLDIITYFPYTWQLNQKDRAINLGYHDVPWEEPELLRRLLVPHVRDRWIIRQTRNLRRWLQRKNVAETTPETTVDA